MVILEDDRELFIGAKVTIDKLSPYWNENDRYNPRGIVGKVTGVLSEDQSANETWWRVEWSNGHMNSYEDGDLKILGVVVDERI